jgi:mannitol-specific phosphotransferase system IIBC component
MFENIGSKIKSIAKVFFAVEAIGSVIAGIAMVAEEEEAVYLLIAVGGFLVAWVTACFLYGFGQLIENSDIIAEEFGRKNMAHQKKEEKAKERKQVQQTKVVKATIANPAVDEDEFVDITCTQCNAALSFTKSQLQNSEDLTCPVCDAKITL